MKLDEKGQMNGGGREMCQNHRTTAEIVPELVMEEEGMLKEVRS